MTDNKAILIGKQDDSDFTSDEKKLLNRLPGLLFGLDIQVPERSDS